MGHQQLLLIVLCVVIVGVAIMFGILLFRQNSIDQNPDMLINEGINLANNAITYFRKPKTFGGDENSFIGWVIPSQIVTRPNRTYDVIVSPTEVEIIGTGNDLVSGIDSVKVKFTVIGTGIQRMIINLIVHIFCSSLIN